jgi:hypothetical protein
MWRRAGFAPGRSFMLLKSFDTQAAHRLGRRRAEREHFDQERGGAGLVRAILNQKAIEEPRYRSITCAAANSLNLVTPPDASLPCASRQRAYLKLVSQSFGVHAAPRKFSHDEGGAQFVRETVQGSCASGPLKVARLGLDFPGAPAERTP